MYGTYLPDSAKILIIFMRAKQNNIFNWESFFRDVVQRTLLSKKKKIVQHTHPHKNNIKKSLCSSILFLEGERVFSF